MPSGADRRGQGSAQTHHGSSAGGFGRIAHDVQSLRQRAIGHEGPAAVVYMKRNAALPTAMTSSASIAGDYAPRDCVQGGMEMAITIQTAVTYPP